MRLQLKILPSTMRYGDFALLQHIQPRHSLSSPLHTKFLGKTAEEFTLVASEGSTEAEEREGESQAAQQSQRSRQTCSNLHNRFITLDDRNSCQSSTQSSLPCQGPKEEGKHTLQASHSILILDLTDAIWEEAAARRLLNEEGQRSTAYILSSSF